MNAMNNKKGLSEVVGVVIMIMLVIAAVAIVWTTVNVLIKKGIDTAESCSDISGKIELNGYYTCYYYNLLDTNPNYQRVRFSITRKDIDIDEVIVAISEGGATQSYTITTTAQTISGLEKDDGTTDNIVLPDKNAGLSYRATGYDDFPDMIEISPVINGKQCEVVDSINEIDDCALLV